MKRFIISIIAFTVVTFLTLFCVDSVISNGLKKSETKHFNNLTQINQGKLNVDLIVNGSSKALVQIDPIIIDSVLGITSYNLGLDGSPFIPQKAQYELYRMKNKKPKIIVQIVSNGTLRSLQEGFNLPIKFAPYLNVPEVKDMMILTSSFSYLDYNIPMLKYSGKPYEIILGGLSFVDIQVLKTTDIKGYAPNDLSWPESKHDSLDVSSNTNEQANSEINNNIETFTTLDSISCDHFERFLSQCYKDNIIVFLVYPPIYEDDFKSIKHLEYYHKVAQENNAHFLNYSKDPVLAFDRQYFYNSQHLNLEGATLFTNKLANDIKAGMQNKINNE